MRRLVFASSVAVSVLVGCRQRGSEKPKEEHLALRNCSYETLRVYALFDATVISFAPLRFGIATDDGLDPSISDGLVEEVARTGRAGPDSATIHSITGRLDDLWVVVRGWASPSSDFDAPRRLVRRRGGKWEAIPMIEEGATYEAPALYRGGAIVRVGQLGRTAGGTRILGIDLPAGIDATKLLPPDPWELHAIDGGHVVIAAKSGVWLLGPSDTRAKQILVSNGDCTFSGSTRARFRVHAGGASYRLDGEKLVLAEPSEPHDAGEFEGRRSWFEGHDGEVFVRREEAHKLSAKATLARERRPKAVFDCPSR